VEPDPMMQALVVDPVEAAVETLAETVIGNSEVDLDGLRSSVRAVESNEGNLIADALKWQAEHKLTSNLSNSRGEWGAMK
ncbi:MAG TPA: hypothetical protein VE136_05805, partial [Anaerolineales bacterium]|nr:hypothetical protein [Anaerolineales bacterium]